MNNYYYSVMTNATAEKFAEELTGQDTTPPALSRWLWLTLLVGGLGLILIIGKFIQNVIMIKLLKMAKNMENEVEEKIQESSA